MYIYIFATLVAMFFLGRFIYSVSCPVSVLAEQMLGVIKIAPDGWERKGAYRPCLWVHKEAGIHYEWDDYHDNATINDIPVSYGRYAKKIDLAFADLEARRIEDRLNKHIDVK